MKKLIAATMILASTLAIAGCDNDNGWHTLQQKEMLVVYNAYMQLKVFKYETNNIIKFESHNNYLNVKTSYSTYKYYGDTISWQLIQEK